MTKNKTLKKLHENSTVLERMKHPSQKKDNSEKVDESDSRENKSEHIPVFTKQELQTAIDCPKRGRAGDTKGIKTEDLKECDDATKEMMRNLFRRDHQTRKHDPEFWSTVVIKVMFNKGDATRPENYRSMCTLSTSYKVFSSLIYNMLYRKLDRFRPSDQGGFRRNFQTTDRLMTYKTDCPNKRSMGYQHVGRNDRPCKVVRYNTSRRDMENTLKI